MKTRHTIALVLMVTLLLGLGAVSALGQALTPAATMTVPPSSVAGANDAGVKAHTSVRYIAPGAVTGTPQSGGPPFSGYLYQTPASIACIYGLQFSWAGCNPNVVTSNPKGGSRAIAIVDAFDDANAFADLQAFSAQFGLAPITATSFQVVYAPPGGLTPGSCSGPATQPPSAALYGWDVEESLDIEYAHAMAPSATLYLVEAQSNFDTDLYCAVTVASNLVAAAGGGEVSMSWGGGESPDEVTVDPIFTKRKVVYFAASGDSPGVIYPSASPNVVSVGGTSLSMNLNNGKFESENTWQEGGGGLSAYESRPFYQDIIAGTVGSQRGLPDVSADANLYTGVWVLDSLVFGPGSWYIVGGTSVATPITAGIVNAAHSFAQSSQAELLQMYLSPFGFTDTTVGSCGPYMGYLAKPGWDFCTGLGSPRGYFGK
jgi:kumamolisin